MESNAGMTLKGRLYLMLGSMLLGLFIFGAYSVFELRQHILDEKKLMLAALVDSAHGVMEQQYDLFKAGKISEDEAKRLAKDSLRKSRYNKGADYFFIYDFDGINLMHASKPDREGKSFIDSADPNGKRYIKLWIDQLKRDRHAYIDYMFPKAGSKDPIAKISYAKVFEPWGWWVGTGVYIEDVDADFHAAAVTSVIFLLIIGGLLAFLGGAIKRNVEGQIGGEPAVAAHQVEDFARGDLTRTIISASKRPGNLLGALGTMQTRLTEIVRGIRGDTEVLARESGNLAISSNEISLAARNQAESSAATAAAIEELTVSINEVSEIARATEENARQTADLAAKGSQVVQQATKEIENIATSVHDSTERIQTLVGRSQEIGNITQVIKEIADQTNLLALNAAIEAARAGEQGRGFAVVADEVRKLAERTTTATAEISQMVSAIQGDTQLAVESMEGTAPRVRGGQDLAHQASEVLHEIEQQANDSLVKAKDVASATQAQAATANDIAGHVETIASMTEQTNAATQNNAEAASQLKNLAEKLQSEVAYFKV